MCGMSLCGRMYLWYYRSVSVWGGEVDEGRVYG
jgi:hypothetical protein